MAGEFKVKNGLKFSDNSIQTAAAQPVLVSGTSIKTINNESLLGSGNISISGTAGPLDDLTDVVITSPSTGQVLKYNGTNWINDTVSGGSAGTLDDLTDVVITSPSTGQVLKYNGTNWINDTDSGIALTNLSVTDAGGDGSLSYNNTTGVFTYTGPSATEVRAHFTAGQNISIVSGKINVTDVITIGGGTITGTLEVNTNSSGDAVRINQIGTGNALVVEDSTNPDATPTVVDSRGNLILGKTTRQSVIDNKFEVHSTGSESLGGAPSAGLYNWSATASHSSYLSFFHYPSGVVGTTTTANASGDALGRIRWYTQNGAGTLFSASIAGTTASDLISVNLTYTANSHSFSGAITSGTWNGSAIGVAYGGTGQTTQQAAINALAGATTSGQFLRGNGTNVQMSAIQVSDVPILNQNTTGTAANVTGTVAIANGGTGQTTQQAAINALLPSQSTHSGKYLTTDGTNVSWATVAGGGGATYTISAETATGGVNLRLTGSDASTDDVKFAEGSAITLTRTDANTITVAAKPKYTRTVEVPGGLSVFNGSKRWWIHDTFTIIKLQAYVTTAPTGASVNIRVNKNAVSAATLSITAGQTKANATVNIALAADDYVTVDVTQVGSTVTGQDLVLIFVYE